MTERSVAVVAPSSQIPGGQSVQAAILTEKLRDDGWNVTFLATDPEFPRPLGWLRRYRYLRTVANEMLYGASLRGIGRGRIAHVFSASYWSFLLAPLPAMVAARLLGRRVVLNYHSGEAEDHLRNWGVLVRPWLRLAHRIVVPSRYLREVFAEFGFEAVVIPNVVDTSRYRYRERSPLRPRFLSTRNFEPYYRVDNTLEAFRLVRERYPQATLELAGVGSEEPRLRRLAESIGGVRFAGHVTADRMPDLYADADVFLNSSVLDNQPVSILEAFAAGLPVVTTTPGDLRSLVRDGVTGVVVPQDDPAAAAEAVIRLLGEPPLACLVARQAREAVEEFTWARVGPKWNEVYAEVLAASAGSR
jgi:L-malate glycosyltransferase